MTERTRDFRILLTGASGQVGGELLPLLQPLGEVIAPSRAEMDLADAASIRTFVRRAQPSWIVNPAAYTAVDRAESEPELAAAINTEAPRMLGEEAALLGIPVIHFSTDYVFAGSGTAPWKESETPAPLSVYGSSKLAGEQALAASGAAHIIFRTSWVYGAGGNNFLRTILRLAREREELRIVADQHGAPTWSHDLARLVVHVIQRTEQAALESGISPAEALQPHAGVYHAANGGETTWFGFAEHFLRRVAETKPGTRFARLSPITTAEYPTAAHRPANSRLDCGKLANQLGFAMPSWQESADAVISALEAEP